MASSDDFCINFIIRTVRADKANIDLPSIIMHFHDQAIVIAFDIENHTIASNDTGIAVALLDFLRGTPFSLKTTK